MYEGFIHSMRSLQANEGLSLSSEGFKSISTFNPPVTEAEKHAVSPDFLAKVPMDYLALLEIANGFELFNFKDLDGLRFLGLPRLEHENESVKSIYETDLQDDIVVIATSLGDGDYIALKVFESGEYFILDGFHEYNPVNWRVIGDSIPVFLDRLIEEKGQKFYL